MTIQRVLFFTCMPLEAPRSASMAFMDILLERYPKLFAWFSLRSPTFGVNPYSIPYGYIEKPQRPASFLRIKQLLHLLIWSRYVGVKAAKFGRSQKVQVVLADLAFEAVVAGRVAAQVLGVPLLTMVHDDPVNRIRVKNYPGWLVNLYEREFAKTLKASRICAVICDYMGEVYQERYGVQTTTLFPGADAEKCLNRNPFNSQKSPIAIGSIGSINSIENWQLLLDAVHLLNQKYGISKFSVLHLGKISKDLPLSGDVEMTGWLPDEEFIQNMQRIDIGFLSWGFEPELVKTRRMSFPLKTSSYIQAQVPMLALGTSDSTVVRFVQDYACGAVCISPDVESLSEQIESLAFDENRYRTAQQGVVALKGIFSRQQFFERFERFLQMAN